MNILVTGATGYAGSRAARTLQRNGYAVRGLTRNVYGARAQALADDGIQLVGGDIGDPESYRRHLEGIDVVVHTTMDASDPAGSDRALFDELLRRIGGAPHLVYTTGCSIHGKVRPGLLDEETPGNPEHPLYFRMELEAELAASGLPFTVLRPGFLYGEDGASSMLASWFATATAGHPRFFGDVTKSWSWVHVQDLADAYLAVVERVGRMASASSVDGEIFCIGEEDVPTAFDLFRTAAEVAGHLDSVAVLPIEDGTWMDRAADQDEVMSSAKAAAVLGWAPREGGVRSDLAAAYSSWRAATKSGAPR